MVGSLNEVVTLSSRMLTLLKHHSGIDFFLFRKSKHVYLSINQSQRFYPEYLGKLSESICMNDVFLNLKNLIAVKAFLFD